MWKIFYRKKYKFNLLLAQCGGYGDFRSEISGLLADKFSTPLQPKLND